MSRRLGYRSNVATTWESGRRWPTASRVLWAAKRLGVDVEGGLRRFYAIDSHFLDEVDATAPAGVAALLQHMRQDLPITLVAQRAGRSRFQVSRWLKGQAEPRLPDFLRMIGATTHRTLDFVEVLVDPASLPSAREEWHRLEQARSLFWRRPAAQLVLLALELDDYRQLPAHDDQWLAKRLSLPLYEVVDLLDRLVSTGQATRDGAHYSIGQVRTVDTRRHPAAGEDMKRFWAGVGTDRLLDPGAHCAYNVFTVSEADLQRIVELYQTAYRRMRGIVAASSPGERLVLVHRQIVPLDDPL